MAEGEKSKVKPFLCTVCGTAYMHRKSLRRHLLKRTDPEHAKLYKALFTKAETPQRAEPSLEDRVARLEESIRSKPSSEEIKSMLDSLQANILKAVESRLAELKPPTPSSPEGSEAEPTAESGGIQGGEVVAVTEETVGVMKRIFGQDVAPSELGTFMQGLGMLISAIRGPPPGPSPVEEAGRAMFTEWTKTMTRVIARRTAEHVAHEATHGEG